MRPPLAIVLAVVATSLNVYATAPRPHIPGVDLDRSHSLERCLELLDEAHQISHGLRPEQRAWLVFDVTDVAAPLDPRRGNQWAQEAWELSKQLKMGQDRVALQKDALRDFAINDPDRALRLYRKQDLPSKWQATRNSTEDARSIGYANTIFKPVWERHGEPYLSRLENLARFLGATGQYPYAAMGKIALDVAKLDLAKRGRRNPEKILRDATMYFQRDPGFTTTNKEFVHFILATRKIAAPQVLRIELTAAIAALQQPPRAFSKQTWRITAATPLGNAQFDSQNEALLFQLLPIVRIAAPEESPRLLEKYASLRSAPAITADTPVVLTGSVSLEGTADPARMRLKADEALVYQVQSTAAADPQAALSMAKQIGDPYLRTIALVSLAPAYSKVDAKEADSWLADANLQLETVSENGSKLRLMAAAVRAQVSLGRGQDAASLTQLAFDLGEELFSQDIHDKPDEMSYSLAGYDELTDLATSAVKDEANQVATISRIGKVKNDALRAELLVAAAKGIAEN